MSIETPEPIVEWVAFDQQARVLTISESRAVAEAAALARNGYVMQRRVEMIQVTNNAVYRVEVDCGRMGTIVDEFVCDQNVMQRILADKPTICAYEVLGKHSEVKFELNSKTVLFVTEDPAAVARHKRHGNVDIMGRLTSGWGFCINGESPEDSSAVDVIATGWFTDDVLEQG